MTNFDELVASRKEWIDRSLKPWCRAARLADLKKADLEWPDIAGRVDAEATLWTWAWSRFPGLVCEGMSGVNETNEVTVQMQDGSRITGFPDSRQTRGGMLYLLSRQAGAAGRFEQAGPFSIDEIDLVETTDSP